MTPSYYSLSIAAGLFLGGVFALLSFDLVIYLLLGHEYTVSHAMYLLGQTRPWLPSAFLCAWTAVGLLLTWHFWG